MGTLKMGQVLPRMDLALVVLAKMNESVILSTKLVRYVVEVHSKGCL